MATAVGFLNQLRSFIGIVEVPYGSNRTRLGAEFGWNGVPWCAITVSVAARHVGLDWWTASTDQMEAWARAGRNGAKWLGRTSAARPGDLCVWDFKLDGTANHVSTVESVRADGMLVTIGGNESNRVQRAVRSRGSLRGFVRLPFSASAPPAAGRPVLKLGSTGAAVTLWQTLMKGMDVTLVIDGQYGPRTKAATEQFQRRTNLRVTGIVDAATWAKMDAVLAALAVAPRRRPTLTIGARGDDVRYAQRRLNAHGVLIAVDGVFGARTASAVKTFQRRVRLVADGIIGPRTWAALG